MMIYPKKRGQVTVFIILSIILVSIIAAFFLLRTQYLLEESSEVNIINSFVADCAREIGEDAIYRIGDTGGYYLAPEKSTPTEVAYYYDRGESLMPSKEQVEMELSKYMNEALFFCTRNFVDFTGVDVEQGEIKTQTRILQGKVSFSIDYPLRITKGEQTFFFNTFSAEVPVRLDTVYDAASEIIRQQEEFGDDVCFSCIYASALERDLFIEMLDFDEESIMFAIVDKNSIINDEMYSFFFVNRYRINTESIEISGAEL